MLLTDILNLCKQLDFSVLMFPDISHFVDFIVVFKYYDYRIGNVFTLSYSFERIKEFQVCVRVVYAPQKVALYFTCVQIIY